ncbi:MAG: TolC family protein, partial [Nitrospirota bacterium]|nr:TolC family protein [Nitrospirota bacterium]
GTLRQREAMLLRAKHELLKGVAQQVQLSQAAAAQIATYEKGLLNQAQEALRIAQVSFKFGEASLLDVLDAQRVLRQTQVDYAQAKYDLSIALTELERVTGGISRP